MIECPICHVMNEDGAHLCAECGQRFSPAGPPQPPALGTVQPGFSQPPGPAPNQAFTPSSPPDNQWNQMPNSYNEPPNQPNQPNQGNPGGQPEQPRKRLHSPILGGGYEDEPEPEPEVKRSRPSMRGGQDTTGSKPKHLRSPLLGGGDDDEVFEEEPRRNPIARSGSRPTTKGGLRSPLLGSADEDDDYEEPQARGGFPHRSRDIQEDEPQERGSGRGLRSPLLGGGSDDSDDSAFSSLRRTNRPSGGFPNDRRSKPDVWDPGSDEPSGKPRRLRSSLLGGGSSDDYDDYDDEDEEIADPKALRSPLLRAVTSAHEQVSPGKSQPHQPPASPQPPAQPYQSGQGYGNQQDAGSPLFRQPLTPPQPNNNYAEPMSQQMHPQDMQQMQQQQMQQPHAQPQIQSAQQMAQQAYPPAQPSLPSSPPTPSPQPPLQQASSPFARNPEPTLIDQPVPSRLSTSNMPTTVKPSKPARFQPEEPEISSRPSFDKFASDAPERGGGGSVSPAIAGMCVLAIILKGWYFFSYPSMWNQAPFVADQFAEILVMVALVIVIMGVSKGRG